MRTVTQNASVPKPMVNTDLRSEFDKNGYIVLPDLFGRDEVAETKQHLKGLLEQAGRNGHEDELAVGVYVGLSMQSDYFHAINRDPRLVDALVQVIGPNVEFWSDKVIFKSSAVTAASPWHQDWPYWHGGHKATVWLALDDVPVENGCLRALPGTHRSPAVHDGVAKPGQAFAMQLRPESVDQTKAVDLPVQAGTAVIFHDLLLHSSHPNRTGRDRWVLAPTYRNASTDDFDYPFATAGFVVAGELTGRRRPKGENEIEP